MGYFGAHFQLIWGSEKNVIIWKKDHILTTLMWSKCGHFIFQAHLGLISVSFGAQENVVKMWSFFQMTTFFLSPKWAGNEPQNIPLGCLTYGESKVMYRGGTPNLEKFVFIVTPFKLKILDQLIKYHMMSPALPFVEAKKFKKISDSEARQSKI